MTGRAASAGAGTPVGAFGTGRGTGARKSSTAFRAPSRAAPSETPSAATTRARTSIVRYRGPVTNSSHPTVRNRPRILATRSSNSCVGIGVRATCGAPSSAGAAASGTTTTVTVPGTSRPG